MPDPNLSVLLLAGRFQVRGSCAYTLRLVQRLQECGVSSRVICPDARLVDARKREKLGIREYAHLDSLFLGRVALNFLLRELRGNPPQLIHVQSRRVLSQGVWLAHHLRRPFVLTMHDFLRPNEKLRIHRHWCRGIICVSEAVKTDLLARTRLPEGLVHVIASGVESDSPAECLPSLQPGHVPVVGTAGRLEAEKGLPFFLSAAQQVVACGREVEFLIAGAGPEEFNLRRLARELGIAHKVTFVPYLLDFAESLAAMDIFCLPSLQQGLGTVMLEAMALGRPVIATGVGGVYSIVKDGQTGLIVAPSNSGDLAKRIIELLDDTVRARAMGAAARQLVQDEFGVERMVRQTADLYREAIAAAPSAANPISQ